MGARLCLWWQKNRKLLGYLGFVIVGLLVVVLVIRALLVNGTGFDSTTTVTVSKVIIISPTTVTTVKQHQQGKTLWDWLQLLIVPAVLAVGGFVINLTISKGEQEAARQRTKTEREIAEDYQREAALQGYIDKMSELLLHQNLRESAERDEVREIASVQTITILRRLDADRKGSIIQFLKDTGLITIYIRDDSFRGTSIISLYKANLREANLSEAFLLATNLSYTDLHRANLSHAILNGAILGKANLSEANLSETTLVGANFHGANLSGTDLSGADLSGAILTETNVTSDQLAQAKSLEGAIMPDGSKHP